ncbi:ScbA/BarX family gamma-butyrolactone biosynthesis protein [Curtobacterium sp. PhB136]|uniref:ScbA/BarX family gamma-butyrolactone biosynthesis protein n=1 Tax=Curtobacterium sp. PhB136 TaxID=2485181 RepID=UPI0010D178E4|nr:ScbA/BarX family gamma-butyrolactone biosynthesis protein [Curtobacterium sp. PhB136]TCK65838.1 A-factor biosynthesis hotdog protein [Curtobacterium sp. PhB136]
MDIEGMWGGLIPGAFVHRTQLSEVLITDVDPDGQSRFICGAQWPRRHPYYGPFDERPAVTDVAIAAETLRQATIAVFHRWLGVPLGHAFVMEALRVRVFDAERSATGPQNIRVTVGLTDRVERRGMTSEAKSSVSMYLDGTLVAQGRGDARILPPAVFQRVRAGAVSSATVTTRPAVWSPESGTTPAYAVVERNGEELSLVADASNPVYFDHPLDHVPGMVVLEACRQGLRIWSHDASADIDDITLHFAHHLELDQRTSLTMRSTGGTTLEASFMQGSRVCASARMQIRNRDAPRRVPSDSHSNLPGLRLATLTRA